MWMENAIRGSALIRALPSILEDSLLDTVVVWVSQNWRLDEAMSPKHMKALLWLIDDKIADATDSDDAAHWVTVRALFVSLYVFSLRGNEVLLLDLKEL
jgi:hypothetical protein